MPSGAVGRGRMAHSFTAGVASQPPFDTVSPSPSDPGRKLGILIIIGEESKAISGGNLYRLTVPFTEWRRCVTSQKRGGLKYAKTSQVLHIRHHCAFFFLLSANKASLENSNQDVHIVSICHRYMFSSECLPIQRSCKNV